jgi:hypothetical protein
MREHPEFTHQWPGFNDSDLKDPFTQLLLHRFTRQGKTHPDFRRAHDQVIGDVRSRVEHDLELHGGDRKKLLPLYDKYVLTDHSRVIPTAQEALQTYRADPYLYLRHNERGGEFPWRLVLEDIIERLDARHDAAWDYFKSYVKYGYLNHGPGEHLARKWWWETAGPLRSDEEREAGEAVFS